MAKRVNSQSGFTLLEVLIAMGIFAFFTAAYVTRQSYNLSVSAHLRVENDLKNLCQQIISETLASPPEFSESLLLAPETKTLEGNENFEYTVAWSKLKLPDFNQLLPEDQRVEDGAEGSAGVQKSLMDQIKTNLQDNIWQVKITVKNKELDYSYSLSAWIQNQKGAIKFGAM